MTDTYYRIWLSFPWRGFFSILSSVIGQLAEVEYVKCNCPYCDECYNSHPLSKTIRNIDKKTIKYIVDLRDPFNPYTNGNITLYGNVGKKEDYGEKCKELHDKHLLLAKKLDTKEISKVDYELEESKLLTENMWDYYFMPLCDLSFSEIETKEKKGECKLINSHGKHTYYHRYDDPRIPEIMKKYIKIKPFINNIVNDFYDKNLKGFNTLAVHYRGVDQHMQSVMKPVSDFIEETKKLIKDHGFNRIFVCSDSQDPIDEFKKCFGDFFVVSCNNILPNKSTEIYVSPFNNNKTTPYEKGLSVLVDCLNMSRCNGMLRCDITNVADFAKYFADLNEKPFKVIKVA